MARQEGAGRPPKDPKRPRARQPVTQRGNISSRSRGPEALGEPLVGRRPDIGFLDSAATGFPGFRSCVDRRTPPIQGALPRNLSPSIRASYLRAYRCDCSAPLVERTPIAWDQSAITFRPR